jgi:hypothetical protein
MNESADGRTVQARVTVVIEVPANGASLEIARRAVVRSLGGFGDSGDARIVSVDVAEMASTQETSPVRQPVDQYGRTFWESASLRQLAAEQGVGPIRDIHELAGGFWPEDEGPDDFINWLRDERRRG